MTITIAYQSAQSLSADNKRLAIITFDNQKSLNAQTLAMVVATQKALDEWRDDSSICAVVLRGAGDKAFCAGGDIRRLYYAVCNKEGINQGDDSPITSNSQSADSQIANQNANHQSSKIIDNQADNLPSVDVFFENEYGLIEMLATYPKPILAWGSGIVMGGGLGILAASSHKVVTDSTLMAMPEVSIGLFPDAGGSYFLNRMMGKVGLFLGLTGARFTGCDACFLGLGDYFVANDGYDKIMNTLSDTKWGDDTSNFHTLTQVLSGFHKPQDPSQSTVLAHMSTINRLMNAGDLLAVDNALSNYAGDSVFIQQAILSYKAGSAITKAVTWAIYHKVATWSLSEILALELNVAINSCKEGDFAEGVRALLIDKDKSPHWRYTLDKLPKDYAKRYLTRPFINA